MAIRKVRDKIIIDGFIGANGEDSNWCIVLSPALHSELVCHVGLHWGDKESPTHETNVDPQVLVNFAQEIL